MTTATPRQPVFGMNAELKAAVIDTVGDFLRNRGGFRRTVGNYRPNDTVRHYALTTASITGAANAFTTPTVSTVKVLIKDASGNLIDSGKTVDVTHRYEHIDIEADTLITISDAAGEWQIDGTDCGPVAAPPAE